MNHKKNTTVQNLWNREKNPTVFGGKYIILNALFIIYFLEIELFQMNSPTDPVLEVSKSYRTSPKEKEKRTMYGSYERKLRLY